MIRKHVDFMNDNIASVLNLRSLKEFAVLKCDGAARSPPDAERMTHVVLDLSVVVFHPIALRSLIYDTSRRTQSLCCSAASTAGDSVVSISESAPGLMSGSPTCACSGSSSVGPTSSVSIHSSLSGKVSHAILFITAQCVCQSFDPGIRALLATGRPWRLFRPQFRSGSRGDIE